MVDYTERRKTERKGKCFTSSGPTTQRERREVLCEKEKLNF